MTAEKESQTEISEDNKNKSWSSNIQNIKETKPIVNYQERQNVTVKDHKTNNATPQTIIYNVTTKEVYINK